MSDWLERKASKLETLWTGDRHEQEDLCCDNCKKHICYGYPFDSEGSYYYCDECFSKRLEIARKIREDIAFQERNRDTIRTFEDGVETTKWK